MCDIWKANHEKKEISVDTLRTHVDSFVNLGVREVVLSGGEALMHSNLWDFTAILKQSGIKVTLLSTGLLLSKHAFAIVKNIDAVIVSLDGSEHVHDKIRQIPNGFKKIAEGIAALKKVHASFPINGRCVLQRDNYNDFVNIVQAARAMGLDSISFLAADLSSLAFNRPSPWPDNRASEIALNEKELLAFEKIIKDSFKTIYSDYRTKFIAESPRKMLRIVDYYSAITKHGDFPKTACNAPWVSVVIESDGNVLPCFFHRPYGNIYQNHLQDIINSSSAIAFRKQLDVTKNEIRKRCVCSLKLGVREMT